MFTFIHVMLLLFWLHTCVLISDISCCLPVGASGWEFNVELKTVPSDGSGWAACPNWGACCPCASCWLDYSHLQFSAALRFLTLLQDITTPSNVEIYLLQHPPVKGNIWEKKKNIFISENSSSSLSRWRFILYLLSFAKSWAAFTFLFMNLLFSFFSSMQPSDRRYFRLSSASLGPLEF